MFISTLSGGQIIGLIVVVLGVLILFSGMKQGPKGRPSDKGKSGSSSGSSTTTTKQEETKSE